MCYGVSSYCCGALRAGFYFFVFFFTDTATTEIYTLSPHDALPICSPVKEPGPNPTAMPATSPRSPSAPRSEEHTSELQSRLHLVCRLLLEKKKHKQKTLPSLKQKKHN